jgi:hypothetical protein
METDMANGCCSTCKVILSETNCSPSRAKAGFGNCRVCESARSKAANKENPKRARTANRKYYEKSLWEKRYTKKYGLPIEEFHKKLVSQDGRCDVCNRPMVRPCQDHDHATGKIRSLLCSFCNGLLGRFGDDIELFLKAADYLKKFKEIA